MSLVKSSHGNGIEISVSWQNGCNGSIPSGAVAAGESCFVARAEHNGEFIPGKMSPSHKCAYVTYEGKEIAKPYYQVWYFNYNFIFNTRNK